MISLNWAINKCWHSLKWSNDFDCLVVQIVIRIQIDASHTYTSIVFIFIDFFFILNLFFLFHLILLIRIHQFCIFNVFYSFHCIHFLLQTFCWCFYCDYLFLVNIIILSVDFQIYSFYCRFIWVFKWFISTFILHFLTLCFFLSFFPSFESMEIIISLLLL